MTYLGRAQKEGLERYNDPKTPEQYVDWLRYRPSSKPGFSKPVDTVLLDPISFVDLVLPIGISVLSANSEQDLTELLRATWNVEFVTYRGYRWVSFIAAADRRPRMSPQQYLVIKDSELQVKRAWLNANRAVVTVGRFAPPTFHFDSLRTIRDIMVPNSVAVASTAGWQSIASLLAQQVEELSASLQAAELRNTDLAAVPSSAAPISQHPPNSAPLEHVSLSCLVSDLESHVQELRRRSKAKDEDAASALSAFEATCFKNHALGAVAKWNSGPGKLSVTSGNGTKVHLWYFPSSAASTKWPAFHRRHPTAFFREFLTTVCGTLESGASNFTKLLFFADETTTTAAATASGPLVQTLSAEDTG